MTATTTAMTLAEKRDEAYRLARLSNDEGAVVAAVAITEALLLADPSLTTHQAAALWANACEAIRIADDLFEGRKTWNSRYEKRDLRGNGSLSDCAVEMSAEEARAAVDELIGINGGN